MHQSSTHKKHLYDSLILPSFKTTRMIMELGLTACADTFVGGPLIKGISGGERKRTSVGVELVVKPALVFLDGTIFEAYLFKLPCPRFVLNTVLNNLTFSNRTHKWS